MRNVIIGGLIVLSIYLYAKNRNGEWYDGDYSSFYDGPSKTYWSEKHGI